MNRQGPSAADSLGFDMFVGTDLAASGRSATGLELAEAEILHRLMEETLPMTGAPDDQIQWGVNTRLWVGAAFTGGELAAKRPQLVEVLKRSPRLAVVDVLITTSPGSNASHKDILISVAATTNQGQQINRIVRVTDVTVEYLAAGQ